MLRCWLRRIGWVLLLAALYFGGRWGWDALHPGSPARWRAHMHAAASAARQYYRYSYNSNSSGDAPALKRTIEREYLAAINEARRMRHGKARLADSQYRLGEWYDSLTWNVDVQTLAPYSLFWPRNWPNFHQQFKLVQASILARHYFLAALDTYRHSDNPNDPGQLNVYAVYAEYFLRRNQGGRATALLRQAETVAERCGNGPDAVEGLVYLGSAYREMQKYPETERYYRRALAIADAAWKPNDTRFFPLVQSLFQLYRYEKHDVAATIAIAKRLDTLYASRFGKTSIRYAQQLYGLASTLHGIGAFTDALPYYKRALAIHDSLPGAENDADMDVRGISETYVNLGRLDDAEALLARRAASDAKRFGPADPRTLQSLNNLSSFYWNQNMREKAAAVEARYFNLLQTRIAPGPSPPPAPAPAR